MIFAICLIILICAIPGVLIYYYLDKRLAAKGNRHADLYALVGSIVTFCVALLVLYFISLLVT